MISKINRIKKLGLVLSNYSWEVGLPVFKQCNLIYGWNGSGKTTLSRLFDAIGGEQIPDLEYEIEDNKGTQYRHGEAYPQKIRVFNQDYVRKNVQVLEGQANSISILLGEDNKKLLAEIEADKILLDGKPGDSAKPGKSILYSTCVKEKAQKIRARGAKFTSIAATIGAAIGGNALRTYRKGEAETDFKALTSKAILSQTDCDKYSLAVKQDSLPAVSPIVLKPVEGKEPTDQTSAADLLKSVIAQASVILSKTVQSELIPRLNTNQDIAEWVEQGNNLHRKHGSSSCEFCLQTIPQTRLDQLSRHFNAADKQMKADLDSLIEMLRRIYRVIELVQLPDRARLYLELQIMFESYRTASESAKQAILAAITTLADELKIKKSKTTESVRLTAKPDVETLVTEIVEVNRIIGLHNQKTSGFEEVRNEATQKLKDHYLSTIFDEVKELDVAIANLQSDSELLISEIGALKKCIAENMSKVSSKHKACEIINEKLATFLGHHELTFVPNTEDGLVTGYRIMHGQRPAIYLSEGEKTAIAFVYFVVHLGDQEFDVKDGVIVVDDPISSLDSNSLYQAFSFLKNAVKDGGQVFILTHSFDFLKLLMNWRRSGGGAGYYMIKNRYEGDTRCAYIDKMDKELCEFESEYHYLFKLLKQLRDEQDDSIAKAYPVPNIARKVWDTFLMFRVPNGKTPYKKMEELKDAGFDEQKLDAIYKFTNDQSHITGAGFNPALVPEVKKVVKEMFEMMAAVAPEHFAIIDKATI